MKAVQINIGDYKTLTEYLTAIDNETLLSHYSEMRENTSFGEASIIRKIIDLYYKENNNSYASFHISLIAVTAYTSDEIVKRFKKAIFDKN